MTLDYNALQFWATIVLAAGNIGVMGYTWITNSDKARVKDINEIKSDIIGVDKRLTKLEGNNICHQDLGQVYDRINAVSDQVSAMKGEIKGSVSSIGGTVDMILEHLLKKENGKP